MPHNIEDLKERVMQYCGNYRHPDMEPFLVDGIYDLFPKGLGGSIRCGVGWPDEWPNAGEAGVYAFLNSEGELLYVGKASMGSSIGRRLGGYCTYGKDSTCHLAEWLRQDDARYVWSVGIPRNTRFEAPALEEFLLMGLETRHNAQGIR